MNCRRWLSVTCVFLAASRACPSAEKSHDLATLERSFWLHASLGTTTMRGYWVPSYPLSATPTELDIQNAAKFLTGPCATNRLYLVYHQEIPLANAEQVFRCWRRHCPKEVELVPTLVLRMYDNQQSPVFTEGELRRLVEFFKTTINASQIALYDVYPNRDQGESLKILAEHYPKGLIRVGIQPEEKIEPPFVAAVQDTWSGFCHGKTNADWLDKGFGAETLRQWVDARNQQSHQVVWDLIVVAWDYSATKRGEYPGYDDAAKNLPLPSGRNRLAAELILKAASVGCLRGFSSDLLILQANSQHRAHDGKQSCFYETLKRGKEYRGYYSVPFQEVIAIFNDMKVGKMPTAALK
jgi:hypothetical protein